MTQRAQVTVPVGVHTIFLPLRFRSDVKSLPASRCPAVFGTRVWIERRGEDLVVHLGDVDCCSVEDY